MICLGGEVDTEERKREITPVDMAKEELDGEVQLCSNCDDLCSSCDVDRLDGYTTPHLLISSSPHLLTFS